MKIITLATTIQILRIKLPKCNFPNQIILGDKHNPFPSKFQDFEIILFYFLKV
jgi:hypothetical protein